MAFGLGLNVGFKPLKPEDDDEMNIVMSIGHKFAQRHGKPTPQRKRQAEEEINDAISQYRSRKYSQSMTGSDMATNLAEPLMQHDFSTDLMQDPVSIDPNVMNDIGTAETMYGINTRRAHEKASVPWDMGEMSTLEKVAGGAGLAAMGLGMAGVGGRRNQAMLGAVSKHGLGYALGAPGRYRQRQDRTLQSELAQAQAGRYEALGQPKAQQQQFEYDQDYNEDLFSRGKTRGDFLLRASGLQQSAQEDEGGRGISEKERLYRLTSKYQRQGLPFERWSPDAQSFWNTYGSPDPDETSALSAAQLEKIAEDEFKQKGLGFATQFQDLAKELNPSKYEEWLASSRQPRISELNTMAQAGEIGTRVPQSTGGFDFLSKDTFTKNEELAALGDSTMHYRSQANVPGYQVDRLSDPAWVASKQARVKIPKTRGYVSGQQRSVQEIPPDTSARKRIAADLVGAPATIREAFDLAQERYESGDWSQAAYDEFIQEMWDAK